MPTKTDRILAYLPSTFHAQPTQSALRAVAGAFGQELQRGENLLAEVMQAHWVDFADRGADAVDDLARMAALYGLSPRDDETVEQFRTHLKRYVRTLLDGTVTVRGVLRIAAEALGLTIDDAPADLDVWWRRAGDELVTVEADRTDACRLLLGTPAVDVYGTAARRATVAGTPDLASGVDLRARHVLYVVVDGRAPAVVDLADGAPDPAHTPLPDVVARLTAALGHGIAKAIGGRLVLTSPTSGPDSLIEVREGPLDAATAVLGLLPLGFHGADPTAATLTGTGDYATGVDLTGARYLRLTVDGTHLAEIDCAGADPAHTTLDHVRDAVNAGLSVDVARHDGHRLILTSPTTGSGSRIDVARPAAQDAAPLLLGVGPRAVTGRDAQPARCVGVPDLRDGVDLSARSRLRLRVDDDPAVTADCAGAVPERTGLDEVVAAINSATGAPVASVVDGRLQLRSPSTGELAEVALEPVAGDAAPALLGLPPRRAEGTAATVAHVTGTADLSGGAAVTSRHHLRLAVDGGPFVTVDLRDGSARVPLDALVTRIDTALGSDVATDDGQHLVLRSRRPGSGSRLRVQPGTDELRRRFVNRAFVTGEAAMTLLGVDRAAATGDGESRAAVTGTADLSHGVDLSTASHLRVRIDDRDPVDVTCSGARPRATVLQEIVDALNANLSAGGVPIASHDGTRLTLASPSVGQGSRIAFEVPQAQDARAVLLGDAPTAARGVDAGGVTFVGVTDLSVGADLPAHAALRIGVDGAAPVDVPLCGEDPVHRSLGALAATVNAGLGRPIASHDGTHLALSSPQRGSGAGLELAAPSDPAAVDVTGLVFGVTQRRYTGSDAAQAVLTGTADVGGRLDLSVGRYLVLSVDGREPVTVDCAAAAADPRAVLIGDVVTAVEQAMAAPVATVVGGRLVLRSVHPGSGGQVSVGPYAGADARTALFGPGVPAETTGLAEQPATVTGTVDLLGPVDLSARSVLLIRVDGDAPTEIDVAGSAPAQTTLDDVVAAVEDVLPGVAAPTADRRLRLRSPTAGPDSSIEVLALRALEVVEFPPSTHIEPARHLRHGEGFALDNDGAGDTFLTVRIEAAHGNGGPALVNRVDGRYVALLRPLSPGDAAEIRRDPDGRVLASIESPAGSPPMPVPADLVRAGPLGAWTRVPTPGPEPVAVPVGGMALHTPWSATVDRVVPRGPGLTLLVRPASVSVAALDLDAPDGSPVSLIATLRRTPDGWQLHGAEDAELAPARPGDHVSFTGLDGVVVGVTAVLRVDEPPYLLVEELTRRFDVTLAAEGAEAETCSGVSIGEGHGPHSLAGSVTDAATPSRLARVRTGSYGDAMALDRGRSGWQVLECQGSRFDEATFGGGTDDEGADGARFAGGACRMPGVFDVSAFAAAGAVGPVLATRPVPGPPTAWTFSWPHHRPAAFELNLPADLPPRFGARFDDARFASDPQRPEPYPGVVTEPPGASDNLVELINAESALVEAQPVATLPIGFSAVELPTRAPRFLAGGSATATARIYLQEPGAQGYVLVNARRSGPEGNLISLSSRPAGPARFDVEIRTDGARFESARAIVAGPQATLADRSTLQPAPIGVDQAKAAGTRVRVTRSHSGP